MIKICNRINALMFSVALVSAIGCGAESAGSGTSDDGTEVGETDGTGAVDGLGGGDGTGGTGDNSGTDDTNGTDDNGGTDNSGGTTDSTEPGTGSSDCPSALFPAVAADPANGAYPDPSLSAYCEGGELVVESNGIPGFEFFSITPNDLSAQDYEWRVPLNPQLADAPSDVSLLGTIAFTVSGLPIFGPNEGAFPDPYGDPVYNDIVDFCLGHTAQQGVYHNHALLVSCIVENAASDGADPIIGYALDGFPIYGPRGCVDAECGEVVEFQSGWVTTGDPTTYAWDNHEFLPGEGAEFLDECNGRVGPDGSYRYHATASFPYVLGCYSGVVGGGGGNAGGGDTGGGDPGTGNTGPGGGTPPACTETLTERCCGDHFCGGPENATNCAIDCE